MKRILIMLFSIVLFVTSCSDDPASNDKKVDLNGLDMSKTVFLGNSLTAGFQNGGLVEDLQAGGWAMTLADHIGFDINYPKIQNPGISSTVVDGQIAGVLELVDLAPTLEPRGYTALANYASLIRNPGETYNNLGVPGAFCGEALSVTGMANSWAATLSGTGNLFFDVVYQGGGKTMVEQAVEQNPTFAFVWLGNNDVLQYATSGGVAVPLDPGVSLGAGFTTAFNGIIAALKAGGTVGNNIIVLNIPDVTSIPYFTTVTPLQGETRLVGTDTEEATTRQITDSELICITAGSYLAENPGTALPDQYWLSADEITAIAAKVTEFNSHIDAQASVLGYKVVDANGVLADVAMNGYNGYTTDFITGGLFSLDGVHPSSIGYKMVANEVIKVLNADFGTDISEIPVN